MEATASLAIGISREGEAGGLIVVGGTWGNSRNPHENQGDSLNLPCLSGEASNFDCCSCEFGSCCKWILRRLAPEPNANCQLFTSFRMLTPQVQTLSELLHDHNTQCGAATPESCLWKQQKQPWRRKNRALTCNSFGAYDPNGSHCPFSLGPFRIWLANPLMLTPY